MAVPETAVAVPETAVAVPETAFVPPETKNDILLAISSLSVLNKSVRKFLVGRRSLLFQYASSIFTTSSF